MPRRRALTEVQVESLLALPAHEPLLIRHWTLNRADLTAIERRHGEHNQLGFALQLCAFRYPGRLLRPGDTIPELALSFVAEQLRLGSDALAAYAARPQTRREQLDALRKEFDFCMFAPGHGRELLAWLLPIALATTNTFAIATALMDEFRRRRIIAPGPSVIERLVAAVLVVAERRVADQLTGALSPPQIEALDALLRPKEGTSMSVLAWARLPPGAPGHRALMRVVDQLACLRGVGLDHTAAEAVHPERLRKLAREGGRFTAQHLRALSPLRRRATLVATVIDTTTRLTDDGVALFDRAVGRMFRRAETREEEAVLRDARAVPNLAERRLYAFEPASRWPALAPFIAGRPDDKLIAAHWDDVLRLTASVRTGVVSASLMLKRLGSYPRQNGLALALREIGRIERTLYTLDWLEQPQLRRQATAELNKGESRNALARAVCFHRLGQLRDRSIEALQHRASGLTLVTAAIALWNTVYLSRALDAVRRRDEIVPDALLAHLAPLGWQHINLTGDYLWDADDPPASDGFRPLRHMSTVPLEAAA